LGAHDVGLDGLFATLRGSDLSVSLVDSGKGSRNARILKVALATIVLDGSLCGFHGGARLRYLRQVIAVFQFHKQVSLTDLLEV
jgi:hypothetical protein